MKIYFFFLILWCFLSRLEAQETTRSSAANKEWWAGNSEYTLRLDEELMLQDCLDVGIRPRHVPAMGGHTLEFRSKSFTLVYPNGKSIKSRKGYGRLSVGADYRVTTIKFYELEYTGLDECLDRLMEYREVFDGGGKTIEELEAQVLVVRKAGNHWVDKTFGVGKFSRNEPLTQFWLGGAKASRSHNKELPFKFIITATRRFENKKDRPEYNELGVLLKSPEGYKDISMAYVSPPLNLNARPILTPQENSKFLAKKLEIESSGNIVTPK